MSFLSKNVLKDHIAVQGEDKSLLAYPHNVTNNRGLDNKDSYRKEIVSVLNKCRQLGLFRSTAAIANVDNVMEVYRKTMKPRKGESVLDQSVAKVANKIHMYLEHLGPERCGMTEHEHAEIVAAYKERQDELNGGYNANRTGPHAERVVAWEEKVLLIRNYLDEVAEHFHSVDDAELSPVEKNEMIGALCLADAAVVLNCRSNRSTTKNGFHSNASPLKDNVMYVSAGQAPVQIWNHTKQDRMGMKGPGGDPDDDKIITKKRVYRYAELPFPQLANSTLAPTWMGQHWTRYLTRDFKRNDEFIITDANGTPFARRKLNADGTVFRNADGLEEWDFSRYTEMLRRTAKRIGAPNPSDIRVAQIANIHTNLPMTLENASARRWVADTCHHSVEENSKYGNATLSAPQ